MTGADAPELAALGEAEEFFEALEVPYAQRVLDAHRLHVMKAFGLAVESWLTANPTGAPDERRRAMARALREAHEAFVEEEGPRACNPFAPGLVRLRRR